MKVFISWSGPTSQKIAQALSEWLPQVIQAVEPWMSSENIRKGQTWQTELNKALAAAKFAIYCLTRDNLTKPWLMFEAGAIFRALETNCVCPYLFELEHSDVEAPLSQFQLTKANEEDTKRLVMDINQALGKNKLADHNVEKNFEKWWPDLDQTLKAISAESKDSSTALPVFRNDRAVLDEILDILRAQQRQTVSSPKGLVWLGESVFDEFGRRVVFQAHPGTVQFSTPETPGRPFFSKEVPLYCDPPLALAGGALANTTTMNPQTQPKPHTPQEPQRQEKVSGVKKRCQEPFRKVPDTFS